MTRGRPRGSKSLRGQAAHVPWSPVVWRRVCVRFGRLLRDMRTSTDISARALAEAVGVSVLTVHSWERGRAMPSAQTLFRLAAALRCAFVDLLPDELYELATSL